MSDNQEGGVGWMGLFTLTGSAEEDVGRMGLFTLTGSQQRLMLKELWAFFFQLFFAAASLPQLIFHSAPLASVFAMAGPVSYGPAYHCVHATGFYFLVLNYVCSLYTSTL